MRKATACTWLLHWGALSAGRRHPLQHSPPQATKEAGTTHRPHRAPHPQVRLQVPAGPRLPWRVKWGVPSPASGSGPTASKSRVCRSRAARCQHGHRAGALSTQQGRTRGRAQCGRVGGLREAPRSRQEPRLHFQPRLLGQSLRQPYITELSEQPNSRFRELREMPVTARGQDTPRRPPALVPSLPGPGRRPCDGSVLSVVLSHLGVTHSRQMLFFSLETNTDHASSPRFKEHIHFLESPDRGRGARRPLSAHRTRHMPGGLRDPS